ncbi:MAG: hypothetical protein WC694_00400 [Candidatus Paceibacterota bacterium]|jgi:hypothetical protein
MKNKVLKHFIQNKILILVLIVFCFIFPQKTNAATLSISPSTANVFVGDTFAVKININTLGKSINNTEGIIQFPVEMLEVLSLSKNSSIFSLWVEEPSFSNVTGKINFNGGVPTPGFVGQNGNILSVTFKAKKQGTVPVIFTNGVIRENDGFGTNISGNLTGAIFYVINKVAPSPTPAPISTPIIKSLPKNVPKIVSTPAPTSVSEETLKPFPILKAPEIMLSIKDGVMSVIGSSADYPQAEVFITFVSQIGTKILIPSVADNQGNFSVLVPNLLKPGSYAVTATMIKEDKTASEASNAIVAKINNNIFGITFEMWIFIIIMLILILILIIDVYLSFVKNRKDGKML